MTPDQPGPCGCRSGCFHRNHPGIKRQRTCRLGDTPVADPAAGADPLVARLKEVLCAAVRGWRKQAPFGSALLVAIPDRLIDEIATRVAPLLRDLTREAVRAELDAVDLAVIARTGTDKP